MKTIFFTGRRPKDLCGYNYDGYVGFVHSLTDIILDFYKQGFGRFISGGAQGFDQLAFWAVHNAKRQYSDIQNIVYVPFQGQSRKWAPTGLFSRQQYNQMIRMASVKCLQPELNDHKQIIRALFERNHQMVQDADAGIALYPSDDWKTANGGTAECIRFAQSHKKPVFQIKYATDNNILRITSKEWIS